LHYACDLIEWFAIIWTTPVINGSLGGIALLNALKWNRLALMVCIGITVGCSEALPIAGGALEGQVTAIPGAWGPVARDEIIQLETNGPDGPYSVNLWTVEIDGNLHVFAGDNYATWVEHIESNDAVRLQSEGAVFELRAERIRAPQHFERFAEAWEQKYGRRPMNESVEETYLFHLTAR
tara:strand:- start:4734 stop:5273 length:540 start_codon:yes stop_codon:yes gene_type:complete